MSRRFDRAIVCLQQSRYDLAETELRQALAEDPDHGPAHALLSLCMLERESYGDATLEAQTAVHLAPDFPLAHYCLARVFEARNRFAEARAALAEAIRLNPEAADHFGLLTSIAMQEKKYAEALKHAEHGLSLEPDHLGCTNLRGMALVHLGRHGEARQAMDKALSGSPDDAFTHANRGWALLHTGATVPAMEHFREALRLDPGMDSARHGIVEALKARNFIYRWLLRWFLWMSRLSGRAQWGVIIGLYVGFRIVRGLATSNPGWSPYLMPIIVAYLLFAVMTWVGHPLFNLLLRFSRFGRLVLMPEEIRRTNVMAGMVLGALLLGGLFFLTASPALALAAIGCALLMVPVTGTMGMGVGWPRRVMTLYTAALGLVMLAGVSLPPLMEGSQPDLAEDVFVYALVALILGVGMGFPLLSNALGQVTVRK